jgi:hypothetical protein
MTLSRSNGQSILLRIGRCNLRRIKGFFLSIFMVGLVIEDRKSNAMGPPSF